MLLTLLFIVAVMAIAFAYTIALPKMKFTMQRDQEEEMIHRGVQYSRAIRVYYKKFGRYPMRLEDLENTNNLRFLRKRYKDPITHKDFKLLHYGEVQMGFGSPLAGATAASAMTGNNSLNSPSSPLSGSTAFQDSVNNSGTDAAQGSDTNQAGQGASDSSSPSATNSSPGSNPFGSTSSDQLGGKTFGGGPIVGVASISKETTIREFNHKRKYNQWQFTYDPMADRGGLITTPYQPPLQGAFTQQLTPGQQPNSPSPFGPSPMGSGNSMSPMGPGNSMNPISPPSTPAPPPTNEPQQQ